MRRSWRTDEGRICPSEEVLTILSVYDSLGIAQVMSGKNGSSEPASAASLMDARDPRVQSSVRWVIQGVRRRFLILKKTWRSVLAESVSLCEEVPAAFGPAGR